MNCYECSLKDTTSVAIAVCSKCGAALCQEHVDVSVQEIIHSTAVGEPLHRVPPLNHCSRGTA